MREQTERNAEIFRRWTEGESQKAIGESLGLDRRTVSDVINRAKAKLGPADRAEMITTFTRETARNIEVLTEIRDGKRAPMFNKDGDILRDEQQNVVEDVAPVFASVAEIRQQQAAAAKLLGLNAPDRAQTESTVKHIIEGIDINDL